MPTDLPKRALAGTNKRDALWDLATVIVAVIAGVLAVKFFDVLTTEAHVRRKAVFCEPLLATLTKTQSEHPTTP